MEMVSIPAPAASVNWLLFIGFIDLRFQLKNAELETQVFLQKFSDSLGE
jgi:hypothetical protein